jgi:hypothetical protein
LEITTPPIFVGDYVNLSGAYEEDPSEWYGFKPIPTDRGIPNSMKSGGALLKNTMALFTRIDDPDAFARASIPKNTGENVVTHTNVIGNVTFDVPVYRWIRRPNLTGWKTKWYNSPTWVWQECCDGLKASRRSSDGALLIEYVYSGTKSSFYPSYGSTTAFPMQHFCAPYTKAYLEAYVSGPVIWFNFVQGQDGTKYSNFKYTEDQDGIVTHISYDIETWTHPVGFDDFYDRWSVEITFEWVFTPISKILGQTFRTYDFAKLKCTYSARCLEKRRYLYYEDKWITPPVPSPISYTYYRKSYLSTVQEAKTTGSMAVQQVQDLLAHDVVNSCGSTVYYKLLRDFDHTIAREGHRIFPGAVLAANSALEECMGVLEANHLENLSQMNVIGQLVGPFRNFVRLAGAVKKRDVVGTAMSAIDLLTDAQLLYSYAISPTLKDAKELARESESLLSKYRDESLYEWKTFYGSHFFEIPDSFLPQYPGLRVDYRAKIRVRLNPNSILASILPVEAFGLLPTLSRMWDLIPFSFVADWFLNIGGKLNAVDTALIFLAFDIEFVEMSMKVKWNIGDSLLESYNLQASGTEPYLSYYCRTLTDTVPGFCYSDLDFEPGNGFPDWKTVTSLAWKLIRR